MSVEFSVPLSDIVNDLKLNEVYVAENYEDIADLLDEIYENAKPFRQWPEVVENIKQYSKAIAAAFSNTNAYESGSYLLIEADLPH